MASSSRVEDSRLPPYTPARCAVQAGAGAGLGGVACLSERFRSGS